jgi:L-alanine-DL-glutamate epimerase-like enolase superfamily enzyme
MLKIKIGTQNDRNLISTIRKITAKKIIADANQGWKEKEEALELIQFLKEEGVVLVEQPMNKNDLAGHEWLKERSPLPIFADESLQRLSDFDRIKNSFHGINIKLMKCTGIREAYALIKKGRSENMQIMLGCMTETSCAISAAAQLAPLADYADLDGNLLIKNDPFIGLSYSDGRIMVNDLPGLGVEKIG